MVQVSVASQRLNQLAETIVREEVVGDGQRSQNRVLFKVEGDQPQRLVLELHVGKIHSVDASISNELESRSE